MRKTTLNKCIASVGLALVLSTGAAQNAPPPNAPGNITPDGMFEKVYDRFGTEFDLKELAISTTKTQTFNCNSGYFELYYENGSGFELNTTDHVNRRNVLCQLFKDLSNFITPVDPAQKVRIWVRNIDAVMPFSGMSNVLGVATSFYTMPTGAPNTTGIADGEIWKTIHAGQDSYTNLTPPLVTAGGVSMGYYHGYIAFNTLNPSINWHTALNQVTANGLYDMYSIGLHEVVHALGFASLINGNGLSKFATSQLNYYSRYDMFLQTNAGVSLITNNGNSCSLYGYGFNSAVPTGILAPGGSCITDNTANCTTAVKFAGSVNQKVYTPNCFEPPSSLSHLEDQCHLPNNYGNNLYYVMSNANGSGSTFTKRYLKEEERKVLCDLGYNTGTIYGNNLYPANQYTYTASACPGIAVGGINDGIANGFFNFEINVAQTATIPGWFILGNDFNATEFECLEDVYGHGTVNITSGNNSSNIIYTANAAGTALLRYIPKNANGQRGNITYIFVRINASACSADPCFMIGNGGFEQVFNTCGSVMTLNCWTPLSSSPDLFSRNCPGYSIPANLGGGNIETWNNGANANDHFIGLYGAATADGTIDEESMQVLLSAPLVPGNTYNLRFRARVAGFPYTALPAHIAACGSFSSLSSLGGNGQIYDVTYPGLSVLVPSVIVPQDEQWHYFSETFTYNGTQNLNNFIIGYDATQLIASPKRYVFIDDVELSPVDMLPAFNLPQMCETDILNNLQQYADPAGGTFSGPYVTLNNGIYSFAPPGNGLYEVTYTYTTNIGCVINTLDQVFVEKKYTPSINIIASAPVSCLDSPVTLTVTGGTEYSWSPQVICNPSCSQATVTPTANTVYTVTGGTGGCSATQTILIGVGQSACCTPAAYNVTGGLSSSYPSFNNVTVDIGGNFTINTNVTYNNVTFRMAPNASITVLQTSALTLNNCKLFTCTNMWSGIYLKQFGNAAAGFISNGSVIEDAVEGIVANSNNTAISSNIKVQNTTMNKNLNNIQVSNYTGGNYLLNITQSTITCVSSANSPGTSLKAPNNNQRTSAGILLKSANRVTVGQAGSTLGNLFNNMNYGIRATASELKAVNNTFTKIDGGFPQCLQIPGQPALPCPALGVAILSLNHDAPTAKTVTIGGTAAFEANTFKDVMVAVNISYMGAISIVKNNFNCPATTAVFSSSTFTGQAGNSGIILENISGAITISQNAITNFSTAISYIRNSSTYNYNPQASILSNVVTSNSNGYASNGIIVTDLSTNNISAPVTLAVKDNTLSAINSQGIRLTNIKNSPVVSGSSYLSQSVSMLYAASGAKYGIYMQNCAKAIVANNNVLSTSKGNTNMHGIYVQTSLNSLVKCNSISNLCMALTIHGECTSPYTAATNYSYGLVNNRFTNTAAGLNFIIGGKAGQQGNAAKPSANTWATTPASSYNLGQTRTDNSSLPANSIFYCAAGANTTPTSHSTTANNAYVNGTTILAATGHVESCAGFIVMDPPKKEIELGRPAMADISTGLEESESAGALLTVYPNPNDGVFYIQSGKELGQVTLRITDVLGKEIVNRRFDKLSSEAIDFSFADNGLYNIEIISKDGVKYFKLVKQ